MAIFGALCCFALKPLVEGACAGMGVSGAGDAGAELAGGIVEGSVGRVVEVLYRRFRDESGELFAALRVANERAWQSLEVALAGESFWGFLADRTDRSFRDQVRAFLDRVPLPVEVNDQADFRKRCVQEIQQARAGGLLGGDLDPATLSRDVGTFARFSDPQAIVEHRNRLAQGLVREIRSGGYPSLAYLFGAVDMDDCLLVHALRHFFHREQQRRPRLRKLLEEMRWQHLETAPHQGLAAIEGLLERQGPVLAQLLAESAVIRAEAREHYLDLKAEFRRLDKRQAQANRALYHDILEALQANLRRPEREVRFADSLNLRSPTEYHLVQQLVAQYRRLPALLHAVGKLEVLAGDLDGAQKSFQTVANMVPSPEARAEAHYNAYQAALQRGDWAVALEALMQAVKVAPAVYAPFPVERYRPQSILGAGGFGVAFLCRHRELNTPVVVKALMPEQLAANVEDVFREAQVLDQLDHPCIIRLRECGYTDPAGKERPYLLLNYFEGTTLEQHVHDKGPLPAGDVVQLGRLVAEGLQAAHARGILHRDVKPANVLVRPEGSTWHVRLIDFGLAVRPQALRSTVGNRADPTQTSYGKSIAGTLEYAAPEQMGRRNEAVGTYSDVFGFGKTLCYALFQTPNPGPKHWLSLGQGGLTELLGACIDENPTARPASFAAVLDRLGGAGAGSAPKPMPVVRLLATPILLNETKAPRESKSASGDDPVLLQVVDLHCDLAAYQALVRHYGAEGVRRFLDKYAARRAGDWKTAARQGDATGRFLLALRLEHGAGTASDPGVATEQYRLAADAGLAEAQFALHPRTQVCQGQLRRRRRIGRGAVRAGVALPGRPGRAARREPGRRVVSPGGGAGARPGAVQAGPHLLRRQGGAARRGAGVPLVPQGGRAGPCVGAVQPRRDVRLRPGRAARPGAGEVLVS
jgi:TPR repeat protein